LAFIYSVADAPELFLPQQPSGTTGLARRLDPETYYIACRWDYDVTPKVALLDMRVQVHAPRTGKTFWARPADWGPHSDTERVADISPGLMSALGITTDDQVEVTFEPQTETAMPYEAIVLSSGHGKYVRGASGILDEVDEARKVVEHLADELTARGVHVDVFNDDTSKDQNTNLHTIVNAHNSHTRNLDLSIHFNAYEQVSKPMGCEVLYVSQAALAGEISAAIARCGFINRGAKKRTDLYFLNNTEMPAVLLEVCFVDSEADAKLYHEQFHNIVSAIADVLGGKLDSGTVPPPVTTEPAPPTQVLPRIDIEVSGEVLIFVNGEQVGTKG
jgi:N-acetylmuramoyl-L-alanine amidase